MPLSLLFCHGWAFTPAFWEPLAERLPELAQMRDNAGYFGPAAAPEPRAPCLAITHSFGTMRLLAAPPPGLVGLVAIAGFDRFAAAREFTGVAPRVLDRMIGAFAQVPETVLADFHALIGSTMPTGKRNTERLHADLLALRDGDMRYCAATLGVPILSLQGAHDPLLGTGMRESVFAAAPRVMRRTHPLAGHLLPIEDPDWCADAIRAFAETLA